MLLLLIRHGDTDLTAKQLVGRTPGVALNAEGRRKAEALVTRLEGVPLAAVYSSPLERAMQTAEPLALARGLSIQSEAGLAEVDYGAWTGRPFTELRRTDLWKRIQQRPADARFPEGEAIREAQARIMAAIERIFHQHPRSAVAVVSHSDVIKAGVAHLLGLHLDFLQRLAVSPASVTAMLLGDHQPRLLHLNDTGSLLDLRPARRPRQARRNAQN